MKSIITKILFHFKEIEIIIDKNEITGIKPVNKMPEFEAHEDEMYQLLEQLNAFNTPLIKSELKKIYEDNEKKIKTVNKLAAKLEQGTWDEIGVAHHLIASLVSLNFKITNYPITNHFNLKVTNSFVKDCLKIISLRQHILLKTINWLKKLSNEKIKKSQIIIPYESIEASREKLIELKVLDSTGPGQNDIGDKKLGVNHCLYYAASALAKRYEVKDLAKCYSQVAGIWGTLDAREAGKNYTKVKGPKMQEYIKYMKQFSDFVIGLPVD
jgi:hypothetical protein